MVICLERGANDLHMVQLMPLPPHHRLLQKNPEWFILLVPAYPGCPGKKAVERLCVCVCVYCVHTCPGTYPSACLLAVVGYDGVDDFFPSLLELIQSKIYGTDIPPVPSWTTADVPQQSRGDSVEAVGAEHCSQLESVTKTDNVAVNLEQSSSATSQYYFSAGFCSKYVKPPLSQDQLEHSRLGGQLAVEHVFAVNGFAEH